MREVDWLLVAGTLAACDGGKAHPAPDTDTGSPEVPCTGSSADVAAPTVATTQLPDCTGYESPLVATAEHLVVLGGAPCGQDGNGAVYVLGVQDWAVEGIVSVPEDKYEVGFSSVLSASGDAPLALGYHGSDGMAGTWVVDLAGNLVSDIQLPNSTNWSALAWSGDYLVVGDWTEENDGELLVFHQPASRVLTAADAVYVHRPLDGEDQLGLWAYPVGDTDGDGVSDIVVSTSARLVLLLSGGVAADDEMEDSGSYGTNISGLDGVSDIGDMDGDGLSDVAILQRGGLWVYGQDLSTPFARLWGGEQNLSWSGPGPIGDTDGDGWDEAVLAGDPSGNHGAPVLRQVEGPLCGDLDGSTVGVALSVDPETNSFVHLATAPGLAVYDQWGETSYTSHLGLFLW